MLFPGIALATIVALEFVGVPGVVALVGAVGLFVRGLALSSRRASFLPRAVGLAALLVVLLLLRPVEPGEIPDDLAEVLLRELLSNPDRERTCYVEVDGHDASPDLLRRLDDLGVRLLPRSRARLRSRDSEAVADLSFSNVEDRRTGEPGTILGVKNLRRENWFLFSLTVEMSSYTGMLHAWGQRCIVLRPFGWRITGVKSRWVS